MNDHYLVVIFIIHEKREKTLQLPHHLGGRISMKNKWLAIILAFFVLIGGVIYSTGTVNSKQGSTNIATQTDHTSADKRIDKSTSKPKSVHGQIQIFPFEEAVNRSDLIAKVRIGKKSGELNEPVPKTVFNAQILETQKSDVKVELESIQIMQQGTDEILFNDNPIFNENEEYILFLKKAVGPITQEYPDLYWITGEESNMYKVIGDQLVERQAFIKNELLDIQDKSFVAKQSSGKPTQILDEAELSKKIKSFVKN
ncbi:hypothetical protein [Paenibacillus lactis]|nr:hypothetical protein [Paenibacillus lactis]